MFKLWEASFQCTVAMFFNLKVLSSVTIVYDNRRKTKKKFHINYYHSYICSTHSVCWFNVFSLWMFITLSIPNIYSENWKGKVQGRFIYSCVSNKSTFYFLFSRSLKFSYIIFYIIYLHNILAENWIVFDVNWNLKFG